MEYASLTPGRDLDALVAERVFGVRYQLIHGDYCIDDPEDPIAYLVCPDYSTNIAACFRVEERIEEMGLIRTLRLCLSGNGYSQFCFRILEPRRIR